MYVLSVECCWIAPDLVQAFVRAVHVNGCVKYEKLGFRESYSYIHVHTRGVAGGFASPIIVGRFQDTRTFVKSAVGIVQLLRIDT